MGSARDSTREVCMLHMGAAMGGRGDWEGRWPVARAGRAAWRPFIPTAGGCWVVYKRSYVGSGQQAAGCPNIDVGLY